jgi:hypothetical protein
MTDQNQLAPLAFGEKGTILRDSEDVKRLAAVIMKGKFAPNGMGMAEIVMSIQAGAELGFTPTQSLQCVAVVNGKPAIHSDGLPALALGSTLMEWSKEWWEINGEPVQEPQFGSRNDFPDSFAACWQAKRKDQTEPSPIFRFSVADAKIASLWGKSGSWQSYPKRMLQRRAMGAGLREVFADALKGFWLKEEADDLSVATSEGNKKLADDIKELTGAVDVKAVNVEQMLDELRETVRGQWSEDFFGMPDDFLKAVCNNEIEKDVPETMDEVDMVTNALNDYDWATGEKMPVSDTLFDEDEQ